MLSYFNKGWISELIDVIKRPNWEFYFIFEGSAAYISPEKNEQIQRSNTLWVFPPNLEYGFQGGKEGFYRYVFHYMKVPEIIETEVYKNKFLAIDLNLSDIEHLKKLFKPSEDLYWKPNNISSLVHEKLLLDLCIFIVEKLNISEKSKKYSTNRDRVEAIIAWYSMNIKKRCTIKEVASENGLSTVHLNRLFVECFGKSPQQFFTEYKVERAKYLMNKTDANLDKIARDSGFFNDSDLCRTFKKIEKITPSRYRKV